MSKVFWRSWPKAGVFDRSSVSLSQRLCRTAVMPFACLALACTPQGQTSTGSSISEVLAQPGAECQSTVEVSQAGQPSSTETLPTHTLIDLQQSAVGGNIEVWARFEQNQLGLTAERAFRGSFDGCLARELERIAEAGGQPCALKWVHTDTNGDIDASGLYDVRLMQLASGEPVTRGGVEAQPAQKGLIRLVDPQSRESYWFSKAHAVAALQHEHLCRRGDAAQPAPETPSGNLTLQCQMQTGQSYIIAVDEMQRRVSARDSAGGDWITYQEGARYPGQPTFFDMVDVTSEVIRLGRTIEDTGRTSDPNITGNAESNELAGLLLDLGALAVTSTTMEIDRNSGVIRTGGFGGPFPNNGLGMCEPWSGRRF